MYQYRQYWFINCNKCTTLIQDVTNRGKGGGGSNVDMRDMELYVLNYSINLNLFKEKSIFLKKLDIYNFKK